MKYVESHIADNMGKDGVIIDGFPRDMAQAMEFENKVGLTIVISNVGLGRFRKAKLQ